MRLIETVFLSLGMMVLGSVFVSSVTGLFDLVETKRAIQSKTECLEFISESFRSSCDGIGFENLDRWESANRQLWNLNEIGWKKEGELMYGFWKGPSGEGEVFQRIKNNEKDFEI